MSLGKDIIVPRGQTITFLDDRAGEIIVRNGGHLIAPNLLYAGKIEMLHRGSSCEVRALREVIALELGEDATLTAPVLKRIGRIGLEVGSELRADALTRIDGSVIIDGRATFVAKSLGSIEGQLCAGAGSIISFPKLTSRPRHSASLR